MAANWSQLECEAIVEDYFTMLSAECRQEGYSKTEHRRQLQMKLSDRSGGSIEYKHQNISAILLRAGYIYISGYKPAWNYQTLLEKVVVGRFGHGDASISRDEQSLIHQVPITTEVTDWEKVFVDPPALEVTRSIGDKRQSRPRFINFAEREARNRDLGERGEAFVMELEQARLSSIGREDLVADVEWTSKEKGDGAGYDIRSFAGSTDEPLFIEVKTTNSGKYQPFLISANEVAFSDDNADQYSLYRVFDFRGAASVFELAGAVNSHVHLDATIFRAGFR